MTTLALGSIASFLICVISILALRPIAVAIDLVDKPGGRKTHHGEVPIIGGLAMFLGLVVGIGLIPADPMRSATFMSACALLVVTGLLDDRFDLSPWLRLPAQAAATLLVIYAFFPEPILTFGDPLGLGEIRFDGLAAYALTLVFVVGAINAFNMLDGMDGLAGGVAFVALNAISIMAYAGGHAFSTQVAMVFGAATLAFLLFNLPIRSNRSVRCFMGDAGSTLIGFVLALLCLRLTQGSSANMAPVSALWLVALPIFELLWTILRRASRGQSPFTADREHFHHLIVDAGLGVRGAFVVYLGLAALFAAVGLLLNAYSIPEPLQFALFALAGVLLVFGAYRASHLLRFLPVAWLRGSAAMDSASRGE